MLRDRRVPSDEVLHDPDEEAADISRRYGSQPSRDCSGDRDEHDKGVRRWREAIEDRCPNDPCDTSQGNAQDPCDRRRVATINTTQLSKLWPINDSSHFKTGPGVPDEKPQSQRSG